MTSVRQYEVGEHRSRFEMEPPATLILLDKGRAGDVRRHQVGRELNAAEVLSSMTAPRAWTREALPSPGTPSSSTCPPASSATMVSADDPARAHYELAQPLGCLPLWPALLLSRESRRAHSAHRSRRVSTLLAGAGRAGAGAPAGPWNAGHPKWRGRQRCRPGCWRPPRRGPG